MKRQFNYEIGDYVKYEGNLSILSNILRDPDIGRIEEFGNNIVEERVYLYLLKKKQHIWCDFRDINILNTGPEHLKALNFTTFERNGRIIYQLLGGLTISGGLVQTPKTNYLFPYCIADFSNIVLKIEDYIVNGDLNKEKFEKDFPNVHNINDLFKFLEGQGRIIDKERILLE